MYSFLKMNKYLYKKIEREFQIKLATNLLLIQVLHLLIIIASSFASASLPFIVKQNVCHKQNQPFLGSHKSDTFAFLLISYAHYRTSFFFALLFFCLIFSLVFFFLLFLSLFFSSIFITFNKYIKRGKHNKKNEYIPSSSRLDALGIHFYFAVKNKKDKVLRW